MSQTLGLVVLGVYVVLSVALFSMYGRDKAAAQQGERRTPEARLHLVALLGGWPGGLAGQRVFHHKTRKRSFQFTFWLTVFANCLVVAWLLSR